MIHQKDPTPLKFFKSDEARLRVIHQMCGSKQPFEEFYANHLAEVERRKHNAHERSKHPPLRVGARAVRLLRMTLGIVRRVWPPWRKRS